MPANANTRNAILLALDRATYKRVAAALELVDLSFKQPVYEPHDPPRWVYFLESGVVSQVIELGDGTVVETNTVGREGFCGLPVFLGATQPYERAFCQIPGSAMRMSAKALQIESERNGLLNVLLLRYARAVLITIAQSAACNRVHTVEERMSRWLLMTHDRVDSDDFPLTQEFLGQMLGVSRPTVNLAGSALQRSGLIRYSRGRITIVDRPGLEGAACECYLKIRAVTDEVVAPTRARAAQR